MSGVANKSLANDKMAFKEIIKSLSLTSVHSFTNIF